MPPDSLPAIAMSFGNDRPPTRLLFSLTIGAAMLYSFLQVGYASGFISASTYDTWSSILMVGSIVLGIGIAGAFGYIGLSAHAGVLVGIAPVFGLFVGSLVTVSFGIGHYDSSPYVLVGGLLLACGALSGVAWFVGHTVK